MVVILIASFLTRRGFRTQKLKIREKLIAKPSLNLIGFGAVKDRSIVDLLFAARLQSFVRSSQKDFRLSSAALGRLNIYLAFTGGEILANTQKRRRTFLGCISAPERDFKDRISG